MDADSFTQLALRVLSREATAEEQRTLVAVLSSHPERREEFEQIKITHDLLRTTAPMMEAAQANGPELPSYRLNELRTAVRQHFGPVASRQGSSTGLRIPGLRWILAGGATTVLAVVAVLLIFSDRSVEVGVYRTDLVRGGDIALPQAVPSAHIVTFDQDSSFDQWQKTLAWYQHGKVWVDNENNLLHIVRRDSQGHPADQTEPLAQTNRAQCEQINQAVEALKK